MTNEDDDDTPLEVIGANVQVITWDSPEWPELEKRLRETLRKLREEPEWYDSQVESDA